MLAKNALLCLSAVAMFPAVYALGDNCHDRCRHCIGSIYGLSIFSCNFLDCVKYDDFTCIPAMPVRYDGSMAASCVNTYVGTFARRYQQCEPACDPTSCDWREGKQYVNPITGPTETWISECQQLGGGT